MGHALYIRIQANVSGSVLLFMGKFSEETLSKFFCVLLAMLVTLKYLNSCWMIVIKCGSDTHVPLRMNCHNFIDL